MNTNLEDVLDQFNQDEEEGKTKNVGSDKKRKEIVMQNFSLIERVDKIYVTEDGRQLLREQY
jgi:hypothetical protein